ncbi:LytTR family DNA-binding domain-containing protein [Brochothrix thermosphacta]|uniref:HTH LytTR-type domain-containing protein n=1 Tax=Brochothrix thermosphacta TaxID=2756 RepID=A0A2X0Q7G9_BROTH|nr:LytTR family DNA-binding domain-containing protein [Brochothrix thermosphacta]EUJ37537.1 LytTR family two component transcriptional regulator [Brochothrix thermosphacta DSM 20171 = FSL F6-1036]ODJ48512.1 hypothetical protein BFR34_09690 [Brochothrix thermosphacta DSM 20171 = FSL F6-1036]ODJ58210.1 hypothetical protein BFR44_08555 [Brochothrix thermosphacta]WKK69438.1 LytTR family DNA-binding domain-containing protein [Brochothrix thermosphacta]SPN75825.1 hypothetical protein BTEBP_30136 [Br
MLFIDCQLQDVKVEGTIKKAITQWFYSIDRNDVRINNIPTTLTPEDTIVSFRDIYRIGEDKLAPARVYDIYVYRELSELKGVLQKYQELFSAIDSTDNSEKIEGEVLALLWHIIDGYQNNDMNSQVKFQIKDNGMYYLINLLDIIYFEHDINLRRIRIVTSENDYFYRSSLTSAMERLPDYFCRCHHGIIINTRKISRIDNETALVYFDDNRSIKASVRGLYELIKMLKKQL